LQLYIALVIVTYHYQSENEMNRHTIVFFMVTALIAARSANAQIDSLAHDDSIKRMQDRIEKIEEQMKDVDLVQAQTLGEEAFGLYSQIDQTFLQLKTAYQQQVVQLNQRMQKKWEQIEQANEHDRSEIANQLTQLERDWDRTFERLTNVHDDHLQQLKDSLNKVRGEFSEVAGRAQAELEASNFEARARWEQGHELFLAVNKTYVQILGDQLKWLELKRSENPNDDELKSKLTSVRNRYAALQDRLQQRLTTHIEHLQEESKTRTAQLSVTTSWNAKREMFKAIDDLYQRANEMLELTQSSYQESLAAFESQLGDSAISSQNETELVNTIKAIQLRLKECYLCRIAFVESECAGLELRTTQSSNAEEKSTWTARATNLRLLARELATKTKEIEAAPLRETSNQ